MKKSQGYGLRIEGCDWRRNLTPQIVHLAIVDAYKGCGFSDLMFCIEDEEDGDHFFCIDEVMFEALMAGPEELQMFLAMLEPDSQTS